MIDTSIYKPFNSMVLVLALLVGLIWSSTANAVCSPYAGTANFNEYYFGGDDNFLEVYIKNINTIPEADAQNWTLRVYTAQGVFTDYVLDTLGGTPTAEFCDFGSKAYITYNMQEQHGTGLPSTQSGDGVTVVLFDELGREIDYLNVCGTPGNCTIPRVLMPIMHMKQVLPVIQKITNSNLATWVIEMFHVFQMVLVTGLNQLYMVATQPIHHVHPTSPVYQKYPVSLQRLLEPISLLPLQQSIALIAQIPLLLRIRYRQVLPMCRQ